MRRISQDVWVLVFLVLFLLAFGAFSVKKQTSSGGIEMAPRRTSYSTSHHGLKALYETLDRLHYRVRRQTKQLTTEPEDGVLFIASPEISISDAEWGSLHKWIGKGNLLIIANDVNFDWTPGEKFESASSAPCAPSFLSRGVDSFLTEADAEVPETSWTFVKESLPCRGFG